MIMIVAANLFVTGIVWLEKSEEGGEGWYIKIWLIFACLVLLIINLSFYYDFYIFGAVLYLI